MLGHVNTIEGKRSEFGTQNLRLHSKGSHHCTDKKLHRKFIDYLDKLFTKSYDVYSLVAPFLIVLIQPPPVIPLDF